MRRAPVAGRSGRLVGRALTGMRTSEPRGHVFDRRTLRREETSL